ncbi:MAG: transposase, partial [Candidatus Azobacteroides sp.]|nr:transposase [Candidatus Azobacteroides sp.]
NDRVPPDNNASERAFRVFKVKLKVSGFFKSNAGAQRFALLHSIADTARKNKSSPFNVFQLAAFC